MNAAFLNFNNFAGLTAALLELDPAVYPESQQLTNVENSTIPDLSAQDLELSKNLELLKTYQAELNTVGTSTTIDYRGEILIKSVKLIIKITRNHWDHLPESTKNNLKQKFKELNFSPIQVVKAIFFNKVFNVFEALNLVGLALGRTFSKTNSKDIKGINTSEWIKLFDELKSISSEIRRYGHPLTNTMISLDSGLIPFDTGEETIYLSPKSPEGKALSAISSESTDKEIRELSELIEDYRLGHKAQILKNESGLMGSDSFMTELERFMNGKA